MKISKILALLLSLSLLGGCGMRDDAAHQHENGQHETEEAPRGPHGGRLLQDGALTLELAIIENGGPARLRVWAQMQGRPVAPAQLQLDVELQRLGGVRERIGFVQREDHLDSEQSIGEPHSFDIRVDAAYAGRKAQWTYASYENRTTIAADTAREAGIETAVAGPAPIAQTVRLYGVIAADATRVRTVAARFPGVIRSVVRQLGDHVRAGETLASVESNDSLQVYAVTAPISGQITARRAQVGEQSEAALFEIADFSQVWAEFSVFARDRARLRPQQRVRVRNEAGQGGEARIDYLSPAAAVTQALQARVVLDNAAGSWTPGQFVEAQVIVDETAVAVAVPLAAIQPLGPFEVVFAQVGDVYEARPLKLGRRDGERVEALEGLAAGTRYVVRNSYLLKADIEKSGASHDH